jgi:hypothetical protein
MADSNTPQGTADDAPMPPRMTPQETDDALDNLLPDDPIEDNAWEDEPIPEGGDEEPSDDDDSETPDEDDSEEEKGDKPRDEKGRFVASDDSKVRLDDGSVVTVGDLKRGSLMQADYTRKTQEVAEIRKQATERTQRVEQMESQLAPWLEFAVQYTQQLVGKEPDPSRIDTDPVGYMQDKAAYDRRVRELQSMEAQRQHMERQQQERFQQTFQERLQEEKGKLVEAIPEIKDPKRFESFRNEVLRYGTETYNFATEELAGVHDHRVLAVMSDAIKWRKLQAQKGQAVEKTKGKPPVTPGRRQAPEANASRSRQRDLQTLQSTRGHGMNGEAAVDRLLDKFL